MTKALYFKSNPAVEHSAVESSALIINDLKLKNVRTEYRSINGYTGEVICAEAKHGGQNLLLCILPYTQPSREYDLQSLKALSQTQNFCLKAKISNIIEYKGTVFFVARVFHLTEERKNR